MIETTITIDANPHDIWTLISNTSMWDTQPAHHGFLGAVPDKLEHGNEFTQQIKLAGIPRTVRWKVTEADVPHSLRLTGEGPIGIALENAYRIEPTPHGSELVTSTSYRGRAYRLAARLIDHETKAAQLAIVRDVKRLAEQPPNEATARPPR